jgi:hypothetical protein
MHNGTSPKKISNCFNLIINNFHIYGRTLDPVKHFIYLELTTQHAVQWNVPVATEHYIHIHTLGQGTK